MTKQKKPKTGDVVGWAVINNEFTIESHCWSREVARKVRKSLDAGSKWLSPFKVVKLVIDK